MLITEDGLLFSAARAHLFSRRGAWFLHPSPYVISKSNSGLFNISFRRTTFFLGSIDRNDVNRFITPFWLFGDVGAPLRSVPLEVAGITLVWASFEAGEWRVREAERSGGGGSAIAGENMAETVRSLFDYREARIVDSNGEDFKPVQPMRGWGSRLNMTHVFVQ